MKLDKNFWSLSIIKITFDTKKEKIETIPVNWHHSQMLTLEEVTDENALGCHISTFLSH